MLVNLEPGDDVHAVPPADDADENWVTGSDSDDDSSLVAEEWNSEEVVKNPMLYAIQCLLGENESQTFLKSIVKDQRDFLQDFIGLCWNDLPAICSSYLFLAVVGIGHALQDVFAVGMAVFCAGVLHRRPF
ncbi:hypothetical protein Nepgr_005241 [Nepenthes gracilis]|uniref:Uncharacterized protein n=1 Tax=Nepenthes gracilis TaxID=150966 RepID=A0AAD3XG88_NEPGR|nr:hypothetical protein Nepgr_005241 [Nepenthes gracilis]